MRTNLTLTRTILVVSLLLIPWILPGLSLGANQVMGDMIPYYSGENLEQIAAGSVLDTQKACLARIPKDASDGQRFLAVDSCKQEEAVRNQSKTNF
jgi:hypothetical protein